MGLKPDHWIRRMAVENGMIEPFVDKQVREGVISYGVSSYGYDMRVADEFMIFTNVHSAIVDPKNFDPKSMFEFRGDVCIIPPNSFALARSVEYFRIPRKVLVVCLGKSTYARCFRGDTRVALVDGTSPTLEAMARRAEDGELFWGYSIDRNGRLIVTRLETPCFIGQDSLVEVTLDNGARIHCTPDHQFMLRDGRWQAAIELQPDTSLMPLYRTRQRGYEMVHQPLSGYSDPTHHLSDEWNVRHGVYPELPERHRHHLDLDRLNNNPWNIVRSNAGQPVHRSEPARTGSAHGSEDPRAELLEISRSGDLRAKVPQYMAPGALDQTWSLRRAPQQLRADRSVFWRVPEVQHAPVGDPMPGRKVVSVVPLGGDHEVFCLTVPEAGNFALESGVFVHNCGIIVNVTPFEPAWEGYVTLEISNTTPLPAKIYANEGLAQVLFFEADEECEISYADKKGKYQKQQSIVLPKI